MHAIPDDPKRVAAPYCAPGEIEPAEISDATAARIIYESIDLGEHAYGKTADDLMGWLWDAILNDDTAMREMLRRCKDLPAIQRMCGEIANDWGGHE